jgi:hypothetical protein
LPAVLEAEGSDQVLERGHFETCRSGSPVRNLERMSVAVAGSRAPPR